MVAGIDMDQSPSMGYSLATLKTAIHPTIIKVFEIKNTIEIRKAIVHKIVNIATMDLIVAFLSIKLAASILNFCLDKDFICKDLLHCFLAIQFNDVAS